MTARTFPQIYGLAGDRGPICSCGAGPADHECDFVTVAQATRPGAEVTWTCGLPLCARCAVEDFGRDLCAGCAKFERVA